MHRGRGSAKKSGQRTKAGQSSASPCWCLVSTLRGQEWVLAAHLARTKVQPLASSACNPRSHTWALGSHPAPSPGVWALPGHHTWSKDHGHQLCAHQCHHTTLVPGLASAGEREPEPGPASSFQESHECHACHLQLPAVTLARAQPCPQCHQCWSQLQPSLAAAQPCHSCVHARGHGNLLNTLQLQMHFLHEKITMQLPPT